MLTDRNMLIDRKHYLQQIIDYLDDGQIKVITGIRRSGKSVLLFDLFGNYLLSQGVKEDEIIKIQLDQRKNAKLRNPIVLADYIEHLAKERKNTKIYVFIDEIQFCLEVPDPDNKGEKINIYDLLNEIRAYPNLEVFITGSNSRMLSKDIATQFRGRASKIHIYPFSFAEFHSYSQQDKRDDFDQYLIYGGMPYLLTRKNDLQKKNYLMSLYDEVYLKDIKERNKIEKIDVLEKILDYLSSSISSLTNPNNIANALQSMNNVKISPSTVAVYLDHIQDAFLVEQAKRYDIKGKRYFDYPHKYYYCDVGLRNARLNFRQQDRGHLIENIIYNELRMRGYSVDVGVVVDTNSTSSSSSASTTTSSSAPSSVSTSINREIDFVVNYGDKKVYIQSAYDIPSAEKEKSETASLKMTGDFFQKIVIRNDISGKYTDNNGIIHYNIIDFLLADKADNFLI